VSDEVCIATEGLIAKVAPTEKIVG